MGTRLNKSVVPTTERMVTLVADKPKRAWLSEVCFGYNCIRQPFGLDHLAQIRCAVYSLVSAGFMVVK